MPCDVAGLPGSGYPCKLAKCNLDRPLKGLITYLGATSKYELRLKVKLKHVSDKSPSLVKLVCVCNGDAT